MLAVGLVTVLILSLAALITSTLRSNQKASMLAPAAEVAETLMTQEMYGVENDLPAGSHSAFWDTDGIWKDSTVVGVFQSGGVDYEYRMQRRLVAGLGGPPPNRVKKVDLSVWWLNTRNNGGDRQGSGKLELHVSRLVNEVAPP